MVLRRSEHTTWIVRETVFNVIAEVSAINYFGALVRLGIPSSVEAPMLLMEIMNFNYLRLRFLVEILFENCLRLRYQMVIMAHVNGEFGFD